MPAPRRQARPSYRITKSGPNYRLAPWSSRMLAGLVDYGVPGLIIIFAAFLPQWWLFGLVLALVTGFQGWNQWQQGTGGQSVGKKFARISLIRESDAQPIGPNLAIGRYLLHVIDFPVGYFWPLTDEKNQTFADILVKSVVIEENY